MRPHDFIDEWLAVSPAGFNPRVGGRVRLTGQLVNPDSTWLPVEEGMTEGLEGTIVHVMLDGPREYHQIQVNWDNGRSLGLVPSDPFILLPEAAIFVPGNNP